jgi:hypothetical protein
VLLERIEDADELAAIQPERVRDRRLRLARPLSEKGEDAVVVRVEAGRLELRDVGALDRVAEAREEEAGRGHELLGHERRWRLQLLGSRRSHRE